MNVNVFNLYGDSAIRDGLDKVTKPLREAAIERIAVKQGMLSKPFSRNQKPNTSNQNRCSCSLLPPRLWKVIERLSSSCRS